MIKEIHPDSPLGKVTAAEEALQAERQVMARLVQQRQVELAEVQAVLDAVPVDTDDLQAVAEIQVQEAALVYLLAVARKKASCLTGELDEARKRIGLLGQRLLRLESAIATLEDENQVAPYSPVERRQKLVEKRFKLAALAGDPKEAAELWQELETLVGDSQKGRDVLQRLRCYSGDLRSLTGLPRAVIRTSGPELGE